MRGKKVAKRQAKRAKSRQLQVTPGKPMRLSKTPKVKDQAAQGASNL